MTSLIVHIPHASTVIPVEARKSFLLPEDELRRELLMMTDAYTDELFLCPSSVQVVAPVSRLVVDVERFREDAKELMSSRGMGAIYEVTAHKGKLRAPLRLEDKEVWLRQWYDPHHEVLTNAVRHSLDQYGRALIIDAHSFPSRPLPYEIDQGAARPDICLGTDSFHTPSRLIDLAVRYFANIGLETEINRPFAGSMVPAPYYSIEPAVSSLMIEVNRRLYMNEDTGSKNARFSSIQRSIENFLNDLSVFSV
ncbi:N-formylglutamate amidohydrolase [Rhodomicrobium lacus]|uniref:N-formylglutamate amidohydrolase n=1 Tax=Rhodomicrobium lacus TaxID=2498452 RepID=UPI000F8E6054|nr:N-formylglutamate amidohydrolase [Rhodomicrobium lacus]